MDFVVVGAGITGLSAALELAKAGQVLVVTKDSAAESNTSYAQGGIAVARGGEQDVTLHFEDTINAGDGLVDREAAQLLVEMGPRCFEDLLEAGAQFDQSIDGGLERTREGAHSLPRILHANGDATGREIARALLVQATSVYSIEIMEWTSVIDVVVEGSVVVGINILSEDGSLEEVRAKGVLLACGGAGQVFADTTNPAVATGDGVAIAYRAGAAIEDLEFYQFHPTAFAWEGAPRFLLSEALRGEGALLRNARGECFMGAVHAMAELAPRDVVARAITRELSDGPVYLDTRHIEHDLKKRFPGISQFLANYGLELGRDLIPVRPAAHYMMGGIKVDLQGRSTLRGLYAAGETACTGVHGANRLASNSLLEGLVFGVQTAKTMIAEQEDFRPAPPGKAAVAPEATSGNDEELEEWIMRLRSLMWRDAALLRDAEGLLSASSKLAEMRRDLPGGNTRRAIEARNLLVVAGLMVQAALAREESRGAHYRLDYPGKWDRALHSVVMGGHLEFVASA